jgi:glycosyltransferase involved in cell wall biosynthesis
MKVLFLNWRDIKNPQAGGAELVTHELAKALRKKGDDVVFFAADFPGAKKQEIIDGIKVYRGGSKFTVPWYAYRFYKRNQPFDLVIDECNTNQFFTWFYVPRNKRIFLIHQPTRSIWFYQLIFPLSLIGYLLEPLFLWFHRRSKTVTISNSTKDYLKKYGFKEISIIPMGLDFEPLGDLPDIRKSKSTDLNLIYVGRLVQYKRVHDIIKSLEYVCKKFPKAKLDIIGNGHKEYTNHLHKLTERLGLQNNINFRGRVSLQKRNQLMSRAHIILVTSVLEGWGLIVSEANALGTPACVYNVGGLRDSVQNRQTGLVTKENSPQDLAESVIAMYKDKSFYARMRHNAWKFSQTLTFDQMNKDFIRIISNSQKHSHEN